jgi:hypothetical protein
MSQKFVTFWWLGSQGRLGNQLYQIATAFAYAKHFGYRLLINWTYYSEYLNHSVLTYDCGRNPPLLVSAYPADKIFQFEEPFFRFSPIPAIPDGSVGIDLRGYFQSTKYFSDCADDVKRLFALKECYMKEIYDWVQTQNIDLTKTVSLHVRRTDFVQNPNVPLLPTSWYVAALGIVPKTIDTVLIFSDDIEWCKNNLANLAAQPFNTRFVENLSRDILDLHLMSLCRCHIIANSSFSQWGAWLNPNKDKLVISPALDQLYTNVDMRDTIEPSWTLLNKHGIKE